MLTEDITDEALRHDAERMESMLPQIIRRLFTLNEADPAVEMPVGQLKLCRVLQEGPQTLTNLAERLGTSSSAMTQIADRLERSGYVERVSGEDDRRIRRLQLSESGEDLMCRRQTLRRARAEEALRLMRPDQRVEVMHALNTLARAALAVAPEREREDPLGLRQEQ